MYEKAFLIANQRRTKNRTKLKTKRLNHYRDLHAVHQIYDLVPSNRDTEVL